MLEMASGGLHVFVDRAQAYARHEGRAGIAPAFWQAFVAAAQDTTCRRFEDDNSPPGRLRGRGFAKDRARPMPGAA